LKYACASKISARVEDSGLTSLVRELSVGSTVRTKFSDFVRPQNFNPTLKQIKGLFEEKKFVEGSEERNEFTFSDNGCQILMLKDVQSKLFPPQRTIQQVDMTLQSLNLMDISPRHGKRLMLAADGIRGWRHQISFKSDEEKQSNI